MRNPYDFVDYWAESAPDNIAVIDERMSLTYKDLRNFVCASATVLKKVGIRRGDLVCLTLPSLYGFVFQIVLHSMGVAVVSKYDLNPFPKNIQPDFLLSNKQNPNFPSMKTVIINQSFFDEVVSSQFEKNLTGFENGEDLSNLFGTSGSTGESKYLSVSIDKFSERVNELAGEDLFGEGLHLMLLPFGGMWSSQHAFGKLKRGKTYVTFYGDMHLKPKLFEKIKIETVIGSPVQISDLLDMAEQANLDLTTLKSITCGGDVVSQKLVSRIRTQVPHCIISNNYGSTEVGGVAHEVITHNVTNELIVRPWVEVEIVDENDNPVPANTDGILRVKSNLMCSKFHNDAEATAAHFRFGYHYPGDLARITHSGRLILLGRGDNVLHLGGVKVNAELLELDLRRKSGAHTCVAFELQNSDLGVNTLGLAIQIDSPTDQITLETWLKDSALGAISIYINPKLPLTTSGKVSRKELAADLAFKEPDYSIMT